MHVSAIVCFCHLEISFVLIAFDFRLVHLHIDTYDGDVGGGRLAFLWLASNSTVVVCRLLTTIMYIL